MKFESRKYAALVATILLAGTFSVARPRSDQESVQKIIEAGKSHGAYEKLRVRVRYDRATAHRIKPVQTRSGMDG